MRTRYDPADGSHKIDFTDHIVPFEQVLQQVSDAIARDTEGKIRRALIELGWTPPGRAAGNSPPGR